MRLSTARSSFTSLPSDPDRDSRFARLFEHAPIGMALCHLDGRIAKGNNALGRMLGCDSSQLPGTNPWRMRADSDATMLAELVQGKRDSFIVESLCRRSDGSEFPGRLSVSMIRESDPSCLIVLLEDATERQQLEQRLRQAEKMEVVGRLAGGVAHDFNNLLTGFLLYCDLLLAKMPPGEPLRREVEEIRLAGEQGSGLTQQILAFARKQPHRPQPVALNPAVASAAGLLRRLIGENIMLEINLDPAVGSVFADLSELRQIVLNLALNARDALKVGGTIRIRTLAARFPETSATTGRPDAACLTVEDDGCGMSAEVRTRLFEPFFTTKQVGEGAGLGLGTVHRIVTEARGKIEVVSQPGHGTRINVFFPLVSNTIPALPDAPDPWKSGTRNSLSPAKGDPRQ
jgi:two-component system, cell cycle sensor histidine kinase and response regulator CckA